MRKKTSLFFLAWLVMMGLLSSCNSEDLREVEIFSSRDGALIHKFKVEIADDPGERTLGLMYRKELGPDRGMLFIFPEEVTGSFWMKNTLIPLDIIFIGSDRKIISIAARAAPQTTTSREPGGPYRYVLEINGGRAAKLGIASGDTVRFR